MITYLPITVIVIGLIFSAIMIIRSHIIYRYDMKVIEKTYEYNLKRNHEQTNVDDLLRVHYEGMALWSLVGAKEDFKSLLLFWRHPREFYPKGFLEVIGMEKGQ